MRVASTAVSMVPWPDIITTGMVSWPLAAHSLSSVMPSVSGIQMSSSTRSGRAASRAARAAAAFSAERTSWPSSVRISESSSRMPTSSSTTSIWAILFSVCRQRQPDCHLRAAAFAVGQPEFSLVFIHDLLDDRQAQAGALGLGGHVGLEGAGQQLRAEAGAVVAHRQRHPALLAARAHPDARLTPFRRMLDQRLLGVLDQVVQHLAQLVAVGQHLGQLGRRSAWIRAASASYNCEHLAHQGVQVERRQHRRRRARIVAEVVDHVLHGLDLVDDGGDRAAQHFAAVVVELRRRACVCRRSAESWIGVSGFLISCASRRATSPQAVERCAAISWVMSSNTTT